VKSPADATTKIPTAAMLAGDFTAFASPACNRGTQLTLRAPFVNNRVDPALFSPAAMNIAKRLPSTSNPCGDVLFSSPIENDMGQIISKVDYQMNGNHSLFGRYMVTFDEQVPGYPQSGNVLTTRPEDTAQKHTAHSLTGGDTMVFGSNMVNSVRVAWNRTNSHYHLEEFFGPEQVGVKNFYNYVPGVMALAVNGAFTTASGGSVLFQADTDAYQVSDDVTLIRGNHQLAVGTNITYWEHKTIDGQRGVGLWTFDGSFTGTGLSDLLTGRLVSLEHARPGVLDLEMWYVGAYAQDTWKVGSRVTLNAGLRWEPFLGQNVRNDAVSNFSLDNFHKGVKTTKYTNAPAGLIYPGDPGFPPGNSGLNKQWLNLAPRAGVAWDVSGDGRTAVRASYGLGYDFQSASYLFISATAPPYAGRIRVNAPAGGLDDPYLNYPGGPPHPVPEVPTANATYPAAGAFGAIDPDINSTRAQSWNVIVERQIGSSWQASASYLGSRLDRIWGQVQLNPGVFLGLGPCTLSNGVSYPVCSTTANLQQRRTLSLENAAASVQLGTIDQHAAVGTQDYRALRLSFQRRAASGLRLSGNYTRSYCFGNTAQLTFGQAASGYLKPDDPSFDRGNCTQDRRHIANLTVGAQTPDFANAVVRALASNWNVSGIINARSGTWLTVTTARDVALIGISAQRPNEVGDPYGDGTLSNYLSPAGFAYPASGTLGDHVRSSIEGPAYWNVDLALAKSIPVGGTQNVELRLETFNLLNHFNWGNPVVNLDAANFGQILTQTGSPRILQFGIKYAF